MLHGSKIIIDSPNTKLVIDATSEIETNGRSYDTSGSYDGQGASFVGQGGSCSSNYVDRTRSTFNTLPNFGNVADTRNGLLVGSMGTINPTKYQTAGGGYVYINVDSIRLEGQGHQI
jgi:hypothetical protein